MINICLCDDDLNYLNYYSTKINELADIYHIPIMMETYTSGESLTFELEDNPNRIDIVIIDIINNVTHIIFFLFIQTSSLLYVAYLNMIVIIPL